MFLSSRRGGSNEYPQSMFLSRNKKNNVYPCKPQFYYINVGFKGIIIIYVSFRDVICFMLSKNIDRLTDFFFFFFFLNDYCFC